MSRTTQGATRGGQPAERRPPANPTPAGPVPPRATPEYADHDGYDPDPDFADSDPDSEFADRDLDSGGFDGRDAGGREFGGREFGGHDVGARDGGVRAFGGRDGGARDGGARAFGGRDVDGREFGGREPRGDRDLGVPGEDRYRPGRRRTSAEPLAASWTPETETPRRRRRGVTGLMAAYGWRIYAIPVLVVLTALVVFRTTDQGGGNADASGGNPTPSSVGALPPGPPAATEKPPTKVDISKVPTAVLPDGGGFTQKGAGTWKGVPGGTDRVGKGGKLYTYTVEIEDGINPAEYGGDPTAFAATVDGILDDPRSWTGTGAVAFQRVDPNQNPNPSFRVSLTTPETDHTLCGYDIQYEASCYDRVSGKVVINLARWIRGAKAWGSDMMGYRQYAVNHEVGHALGNGHRGCDTNGGPAPVMMQQTFGVADDYVAQLNQVDPYNRNAVPADGKVCTPNAWPNPDGKPAG